MTHRLLQIRHFDGLTLAEAAKRFEVPTSTYSSVERGVRPFTLNPSLVGYSLARIKQLPTMSTPLHRQRASVTEKIARANREQLRCAGELMSELRSLVEDAPTSVTKWIGTPTSSAEIDEIASEARYMLNVALDEPIGNLTSAVERAGICLTPIHNDPLGIATKPHRVDGLSSWVDGQPVIGINPDAPGDRYRMTLAHELGHLFMHKRPSDTCEDEAFLFASTFLVPTDRFLEHIDESSTIKDFTALKRVWGISIAAGIYRAHQMNMIDADRYRSLQMQMAKWRNKEPGEFEARPGRLLSRLVQVRDGVEPLAAELGISPGHIKRAIDWSTGPKLRSIKGDGLTAPSANVALKAL